jgi:hypothetical protein
MNPSALQILRAALEDIATMAAGKMGHDARTVIIRHARAALEAAAKAPGLANDKALFAQVAEIIRRGETDQVTQVFRAIDAYQRGAR